MSVLQTTKIVDSTWYYYLILSRSVWAELASGQLCVPSCLFISALPSLSLSSPIILSVLLSISLPLFLYIQPNKLSQTQSPRPFRQWCCGIWLLDRWAQLGISEMTAFKDQHRASKRCSSQRVANGHFALFASRCAWEEGQMVVVNRAIPSGSAGLAKILPAWWEAGNKVAAPHIGSAEYLGRRWKAGKVKQRAVLPSH